MVGGSQTDRPSTSTAAEILLEEASDEITKGGAYGICIGTLLKKGGPLDKENKKTRKKYEYFSEPDQVNCWGTPTPWNVHQPSEQVSVPSQVLVQLLD